MRNNPDQQSTGTQTMLLRTIETFLRAHAMPATKFGRLAAHDPRFVLDLRMGRVPRPDTELRTRAWMQGYAACTAELVKEAA
jgi:hypothetical protein